jgi:hypothetical protein
MPDQDDLITRRRPAHSSGRQQPDRFSLNP